MINHIDDGLSYTFGKIDLDTQDIVEDKSIIEMEKYDYEVPAEVLNKTSKVKHEEGLPLSFLQIDNEEEGILWYSQHYPKIPDELYPIIARYHWGEPITKKSIKNEKKKITKKLGKKGITIEHKKVSVTFD